MTWGFAKIILLGEHAVVHGHPAIAAAIDRGVRVTVKPGEPGVHLRVPAWDLEVSSSDDHPVADALRRICAASPALVKPAYHIEAEATVPAAAGLGSSAALCVAVTRGLLEARGKSWSDDQVANLANAGEHAFHDTPSGIDAAIAARGGLLWFRRGPRPVSLEAPPVPLVIGLSGEPRSTAAMVARVTAAKKSDPAAEALLAQLGDAAERGRDALVRGDHGTLATLMNQAHQALAALGVSTDRIDEMRRVALGAGALGVKLTGAGGGGAVIALAPGNEDAVVAAWSELGCEPFCCNAGATR
jgi:mevalonate kinase